MIVSKGFTRRTVRGAIVAMGMTIGAQVSPPGLTPDHPNIVVDTSAHTATVVDQSAPLATEVPS